MEEAEEGEDHEVRWDVQARDKDEWRGESELRDTLARTAAVAAARPDTAAWDIGPSGRIFFC